MGMNTPSFFLISSQQKNPSPPNFYQNLPHAQKPTKSHVKPHVQKNVQVPNGSTIQHPRLHTHPSHPKSQQRSRTSSNLPAPMTQTP
ncbi:unnamed protein product [Periconia digitata]|uniref:Uncharacterized protein n=1 Tax=Periconia digitata TaxID=1303443 RepID=A0A9W4U972_9PLEO|nr:unnamed protein product [Periconia digitata]